MYIHFKVSKSSVKCQKNKEMEEKLRTGSFRRRK